VNDDPAQNAAAEVEHDKYRQNRLLTKYAFWLALLTIVFSALVLGDDPNWATVAGVVALCVLAKTICFALLKQRRE
jgi:hypothetical protein